jgi:hypothetical protein
LAELYIRRNYSAQLDPGTTFELRSDFGGYGCSSITDIL